MTEGAMVGYIDILVGIAAVVLTALGGLALKNRYDINQIVHFLRGSGFLEDGEGGVISRIRSRIDQVEERTMETDGKINYLLVELEDTSFESIEEVERENWNDDYHLEADDITEDDDRER